MEGGGRGRGGGGRGKGGCMMGWKRVIKMNRRREREPQLIGNDVRTERYGENEGEG